MKKILFLFLLALAPQFSSATPIDINISVGYIDPKEGNDDKHRAPVRVPHIAIDGLELIFYTPCGGCEIRIVSPDDTLEFVTTIPYGAKSLTLPSYLSGEYRIEIIRGRFCFWGYISL